MKEFKTTVIGFREWTPDFDNDMLLSCNGNIPWQPGVNYASGCTGRHSSPGSDCHCGFNGWFTFEDNRASAYSGVTGAFAAAGKVELHEKGFRSEEAQILALYASKSDEERLERISRRYEVPVFTKKKDFLEYLNRFGAKKFSKSERRAFSQENTQPQNNPGGAKNHQVNLNDRIAEGTLGAIFAVFGVLISTIVILIILSFAGYGKASPIAIILIALFSFAFSYTFARDMNHSTKYFYTGVSLVVLLASIALWFLFPFMIESTDEQNNSYDLNQNVVTVNSLALLQQKFYAENKTFADDPNELTRAKTFERDGNHWVSEDLLRGPLLLETKANSYILSAESPGEETPAVFAAKGNPKGYMTHCFDSDNCSPDLGDKNASRIESEYDALNPDAEAETTGNELVANKLGFSSGSDSNICVLNPDVFQDLSNPVRPEFNC